MKGKILVIAFLSFALISIAAYGQGSSSEPRVVEVEAYQFGWTPSTIKVRAGEPIVFRIHTKDVVHGLWIDDQKIDALPVSPKNAVLKLNYPIYGDDYQVLLEPGKVVEVGPFSFNRPGKYKFHCSMACGPLHPFMMGDIVVEPNYPFYGLILLSLVTSGGMLAYLWRKKPEGELLGISLKKEVDLFRIHIVGPILKRLVKWRGIHFTLIWPNILVFMVILSTGFFGNPLGALNFSYCGRMGSLVHRG